MPVLDWIGKKAVVNHHREVPYRLIHCDGELSAGDPDAGNLLVQGDNLEALKALLPYYAGKVKCIYIDPPYNTGNEGWIYNDNVNSPEIKTWLGNVVGREAEDLSRHDKWLCMMYPRLRLLREFLHEDGVIFVSIDDNEVSNCKYLLSEIFGAGNFVVNIIWKKMDSPSSNVGERIFSNYHDHILCFAKNKSKAALQQLPSPEILKAYPVDIEGRLARWRQLRKNGKAARREDRPNSWFPMIAPDDTEIWPIHPKENWEGRWSISPDTWEKIKDTPEVKWELRPSGWTPYRIEFAKDEPRMPSPSILDDVGQNRQAKAQLNQILGTDHGFDTPKPFDLVERLIEFVSDENALVLDSFAGSGSTAHAVLALNKRDGGNRRFISVEIDKDIAANVTSRRLRQVVEGYRSDVKAGEIIFQKKIGIRELQNSSAVIEEMNEFRTERIDEFSEIKASFDNNLLTLTGIHSSKESIPGLGGGFRYCHLGTPLFNEFGDIDVGVTFSDLAAHVFFSETGAPLPRKVDGSTSLIGQHKDKAVYLLFSAAEPGISREASGNVLTPDLLMDLPRPVGESEGGRVVYGEGCTVAKERLKAEGVVFKQIPYQIEGS